MTPSDTEVRPDRPVQLMRAVLFTALLALVALATAACGGGDDEPAAADDADDRRATSTPAKGKVPSGWETFDFGAISGAAPDGWEASLLTSEEFLELARAGLSGSNAAPDSIEFLETLDSEDLSKVVLLLTTDEGYPNINVQPCYPAQSLVDTKNADSQAAAYAKAIGLDVEVVGDVEIDGKDFALLKADYYDELDTIQAFYGTSDCVNIATLTGQPADDALIDDFKQMLQLLEIEE